jgi:hypothetical protein
VLCFVLALLAIDIAAPNSAPAARTFLPPAFAGTALWVKEVPPGESGLELAGAAVRAGVRTLYIKAGDGASAEPQFSATLVSEIHSSGVTVCGWTFAYGSNPAAEAAVAVAAARDGAECLVIDAEDQYDGLYGAAQLFVRTLRSSLGAAFPIGLAGQAEISEHPTFPYSVFLAPGGFNVVLPQIYWLEFAVGVEAAYAATLAGNSIYARPILPVGQLFGAPSAAEIIRFRALARAYGSAGESFFDLDAALPEQLAALAAPLPKIARRAIAAPTLRPGADGDQTIEAQELLDAAGAHLPVGGYYGAATAGAVASFQARHRLRVDGILRPATWKALLRFRPREPSWAGGPPDSAR